VCMRAPVPSETVFTLGRSHILFLYSIILE